MSSPADIRETLPTLDRIEQHLKNSSGHLMDIVGIPAIHSDEAEQTLADALKDLGEAVSLTRWVIGAVKAIPLPLTAEAAAFAPRVPSPLAPTAKLPPRMGDAFVDAMKTVAPSMNLTAVKRAMMTPHAQVAVLQTGSKLLIGRYGDNSDGQDPFDVTETPTPAGEYPMMNYRAGMNIEASRVEKAGLVLVPHSTAPLDLVPPRANLSIQAEPGVWVVGHLTLLDGTQVVSLVPPSVIDRLLNHPHWPIAMLAAMSSAIYQEKAIIVCALPKPNPQGMPPLFQGNKLMIAPAIAVPAKQYSGRYVETGIQNQGSNKVTAKELLRQREELERADALRRMEFERAAVLEQKEKIAQVLENETDDAKLAHKLSVLSKFSEMFSRWSADIKLVPADEPVAESMAEKTARKRADAATKKRTEEESLAKVVFSYWKDVMGKPRALFDERRQTRIITRLRENKGDVGELLYAIDGAVKDDWLMGHDERSNGKKYNDIHTIFRDRSQVEKLAETMKGYQRDEEHPVVAAMRIVNEEGAL